MKKGRSFQEIFDVIQRITQLYFQFLFVLDGISYCRNKKRKLSTKSTSIVSITTATAVLPQFTFIFFACIDI